MITTVALANPFIMSRKYQAFFGMNILDLPSCQL